LEDPIEHFTDILTNIANSTIHKSKARSKKRDPVWLNDECMNSIRSRRKATRKVKTSSTPANIENHRIIRAKTRRTIKSTKRKSWHSFVSESLDYGAQNNWKAFHQSNSAFKGK